MKSDFYNKKYYSRGVKLVDFLTLIDIYSFKNHFDKQDKVLEVGCGDGKICNWLSGWGFNIEAIDISKEAIKLAKKLKTKVKFYVGDIFCLKKPNNYYDAVYSLHVMEHIKNVEEDLKEIKRILKRKGKLIVRIPNSDSFEAKIAGNNWFHWDEPYHINHWKYGEFVELLKNTGFKNIKVNFGLGEYKQVLLYSVFSFFGIKVNRLAVLPLQIIFVPISMILGFLFKNSGTVEIVARKF